MLKLVTNLKERKKKDFYDAVIWATTKRLLKYKNKSRANRGWDIVLEMNKRNKGNY